MTTPATSKAAAGLEAYLYEHIPITAAMGVRVERASAVEVCLRAPIEPNVNHRSTVFGGSAAAVAILAGWSLLHVRLGEDTHGRRLVIQHSAIDYRLPIEGDFEAVARPPAAVDWGRLERMLARRGTGRIEIEVELRCAGTSVGECLGRYVVLPPPRG